MRLLEAAEHGVWDGGVNIAGEGSVWNLLAPHGTNMVPPHLDSFGRSSKLWGRVFGWLCVFFILRRAPSDIVREVLNTGRN